MIFPFSYAHWAISMCLFLLLQGPFCHAGSPSEPVIPKFPCGRQTPHCFSTVKFNLEKWYGKDTDGQQTQVFIGSERAPLVFIAIHGLWGNSDQFSDLQHNLFKKLQYPLILLTLPGHGADSARQSKVNFRDWQLAVDRAIAAGLNLGDRVVLIGQSTGGLLSLDAANRHSSDVAATIMIEPALKVQEHIHFLSCVGQLYLSAARNLDSILSPKTGFKVLLTSGTLFII